MQTNNNFQDLFVCIEKEEGCSSIVPGPASTEGDRPPTNPAIRVWFPPSPTETDGCFFSPWQQNARSIHSNYFSAKRKNLTTPSTGEKRSSSLSLYEKERTYKLVLWRHLECGMMSYLLYYAILLLRYCNLLQYQFTSSTYGGVRTLIGNRPRRQEGPPGDRKEDNRRGSWTRDKPWNRGCPE